MASKIRLVLSPFEWFLILLIIGLNLLYSLLNREIAYISTIASISGVVCVVLVAKGHIANYLFGLIQVSLYVYIAWQSRFWGEVMLNGLYYIPMQFIGFLSWRKRMSEGSATRVQARRLSANMRLIIGISTLLATVVYGYFLELLNGQNPYIDAMTTLLSIVAMILMVRAYAEQWVLWICVNAGTILLWSMSVYRQEPHAVIMVMMWSVYLINSVYGLIRWMNHSRLHEKV
ncbi:MAG: nicotinamide riboside transporter PnuC [Bacteroidales bacterium]|nr:nicotinamide riboside transporter PnuC [Bacteroidales bacterium]MCL2738741.1 nicotinamide riboside transporter PnuC [Bacteroidales bacterium]